ncbi:MAG: phosphatidylserine/phosphatidylglycerophosphate/cardiolipin synthase family protein [Verrucomicrobiota bacterium]
MGLSLTQIRPAAARRATVSAILPLLLAAGALCVFPACRATAPMPHAAAAGEVRLTKSKAVDARLSRDGSVLGLRFRIKGRDAFASAETGAGSTRPLTFYPAAAGQARALGKKAVSVPVLNAGEWRELRQAMAARLAPVSGKEGTLLMAGGKELIAHHAAGAARFTPLAQRPRGLRITRRLTEAQLRAEIFQDRGDRIDKPGGLTGPMVLLTGTFPELVFLDRSTRRMVFLSVPSNEAPVLPFGDFTAGGNMMRQLASFVWRSHVLATLRNPFSTGARMAVSTTSIVSAGVRRLVVRLPGGPVPPLAEAPEMDPAEWRERLAKIADCPPSRASLRFRIGGDAFFPDFVQAVQDARRTVDLQMFIFDNDDYAVSIADLLRQRAEAGIRVRVMLDENASITAAAAPPESPMPAEFVPPADIKKYLRKDSPLQLRTTSMSGFTASHTKIIIIDNRLAWLGGMNIGREYRYDWHDLMVEVRGPLARWMEKDFAGSWARAGWGGDLAAWRQKLERVTAQADAIPAPPGAIAVQPLYTSAGRGSIAESQLEAIRRSRRAVWVENAYLSDHAYITELIRARHRGVDVRIIMPADNDNGIMAANNRALVPLLRAHGIRIFLLPGMSHVKAALYDGWACVGSANFDRLSLRVNNEFSIGFDDPATVAGLRKELFARDFARSREIRDPDPQTPADEIMAGLIRSLAGQL